MEEPTVRPGDLALDELRRIGAPCATSRPMTRRLRGRVALRMSICSHRTLERDVEATFEALAGLGRRLAAEAGLGEAWGEPAPLAANP